MQRDVTGRVPLRQSSLDGRMLQVGIGKQRSQCRLWPLAHALVEESVEASSRDGNLSLEFGVGNHRAILRKLEFVERVNDA